MSLSEMSPMRDLTELNAMLYLLDNPPGGEERMQGTIRPIYIQSKCNTCKKPFEEVSRLGYICKEHMTVPRKFFIDLHFEGRRYRIFTDKYGNVLDSYSAAKSILKQMNLDMANRSFNPSHYVRKEKENYYLEARWNEFVKKHKKRK